MKTEKKMRKATPREIRLVMSIVMRQAEKFPFPQWEKADEMLRELDLTEGEAAHGLPVKPTRKCIQKTKPKRKAKEAKQ